jgi:hypothetical protein
VIDDNPEWDPFSEYMIDGLRMTSSLQSQFLTLYKFPLSIELSHVSAWTNKFTIVAKNNIRYSDKKTLCIPCAAITCEHMWHV